MSAFLEDDVAYGKRPLSSTGSDEALERTYDLLWHDLIQHRSGKGGEADKTIMPKIMRELAPGGTFFDPRVVWEAEQDRLVAAAEEAKRKKEEAEKQRVEEEKKQERLQNRMKKMAITATKEEEGGREGGEEGAASRGPSPVSVPEDVKWRQELATKIKQARQTVEGEYGEGELGGEKAEGAINDFVGKLEKLWGDSIKASSKSQKTEIEKKLEKMAKATVKQLKEAKEEEGKAGGAAGGGGQKKKSEVIREKLEAKKQVDDVEDDAQILANTLSKFKRTLVPSLLGLKDNLKSAHGRLQWMLEVIKASLGQRPRDDVLILDCLFALIELPMFVSARKEVKAREKERKKAKEALKNRKDKEGKEGKDKKSSKKDKKEKEAEEEEPRFAPLSREGELVARFSETIEEVMGLLGDIDDVIEFQLVKMANRLPPLSRFSFGRSLDGWQKKVLGLIDQKRSVIVCAPTSSGKTVLSSYVTMRAEKILFVVPTEPLVWQVAAMFYKVLGGEVAVVTNQMVYNPKREDPKDWRCIVGTPLALESALSKPRGREGAEMLGKQDFSTFRGGLHEFEYVIYDEVHTLDGDEGAALQRIIKGVRCNFLALSATIGNGPALREWWQGVHDAHVEDEVAEVEAMLEGKGDATREEGEDYDMLARLLRMRYAELAPAQGTTDVKALKGRWNNLRAKCREAAKASPKVAQDVFVRLPPTQTTVELVDHKARFINLQRWVWVGDQLKTLHPLAAMNVDFLTSGGGEGGGVGGFQEAALPFTPYDSFKLWEALREEFEEEVVEDVDPEEVLGGKRITLERSKDYEDLLKAKLTALARQGGKAEAKVRKVLETFAPPLDARASEKYQLLDVVQHMKVSGFFPAIFFRLDTYSCVELFNELLKQVKAAEKKKYPTYYADLARKKEAREELARKARDAAEKRKDKKVKKRVDEDGNRVEAEKDEENPADAVVNVPPPVDDTVPHPDFVLSSPVNRITDQELSEMLEKLAKDHMDAEHPYIKGLRRGIGLYVDDSHTQEYRRIVQSLAQQGKLAVVFSDHSLAYGVNMPFRTSTFVGDDPELLTPLMAAQMSGRAGRRGLDEQGNLVYLGMPWERVKVLMLGCIPAIRGREPRYPTMALQHVLSQYYNRNSVAKTDRVRFYPKYINEARMKAIAGSALEDFLHAREGGAGVEATPHPCDDVYYKRSLRALEALRFIKVEKAGGAAAAAEDGEPAAAAEGEEDVKEVIKAPGVLALLWELREYPAEGVAVVHALPWMMKEVRPTLEKKTAGLVFRQWSRRVKIDDVERTFLTMLLPLIDREAPKPGVRPLHKESFVEGNPARAAMCKDVEELLRRSQARVQEVDEADRASLLLDRQPAASAEEAPTPLDSTLFKLLVMRKTPGSDPTLSALTSVDWFRLKQRLWKVGSVVRLMHNCLGKAGDGSEQYAVFLLWKTFRRIWYIMRDLMVYGTKWVGEEEGLGAGAEEDGEEDGEDREEGEEERKV